MRTAGAPEAIVTSPGNRLGGDRREVQSVELVRNNATGAYGGGAAVTATFKLDIPSAKLATSVTVGFRADASEELQPLSQVGPAWWLLTLDAWALTKEGRWIRGNNILPTGLGLTQAPLPTTYEAVTSVRQWRGSVSIPNAPGTGIAQTGTLWVIATWEAAAGALVPDDELARLFQACKLTPGTTQVVSQTGV